MKKLPVAFLTVLVVFVAVLLLLSKKSLAKENPPLRLLQRTSTPGVRGKWDHFGVDLPGNRLFLASDAGALVEVFDLRTNKLIHTITGFKEPHSFVIRPDVKKIFVMDGGASEVKIFDYDTYKLVARTELTIDADCVRYEPATKFMYVVNGGRLAHTPYCLLSVVDTTSNKKVADIKFDVNRLESFEMEQRGPRLFINMTASNEIGVLDREKRTLIATWPITGAKEAVPMAFDEDDHRLFTATHTPSSILVFDTETGRQIAKLPEGEHSDDIFYDHAHKRIYSVCAEGFITAYKQRSPDDYDLLPNVATRPNSKGGILVPELNRFYVAAPQIEAKDAVAELLVYEVLP